MNSFLGDVITENMWSEVTSVILYSNLLVFQIKHLSAVISCPREWKNILGNGGLAWGGGWSKKSDCLTHPR